MKWQLFMVLIAIVLYAFCEGRPNNGSSNNESLCRLPPKKGYCRAYFKRYFYDVNKKNCMEFVYGGCGGNWNSFESIDDCMRACAHVK